MPAGIKLFSLIILRVTAAAERIRSNLIVKCLFLAYKIVNSSAVNSFLKEFEHGANSFLQVFTAVEKADENGKYIPQADT